MPAIHDQGFIGFIGLGSTIRLSLQVRNTSEVPTAPSAAPTYSVYSDSSDTAVITGSLSSSDVDSNTGFRRGDLAATAANGFASGNRYVIRYEFAISGTTYAAMAQFEVT